MAIAVNKDRTLSVARQLGLHIPRQAVVRPGNDVLAAVREVGLPAVVKPSESWVSGEQVGQWIGPQLVTSLDEAHRAIEVVTSRGEDALYQQLLTGRREALSFLYAGGEMHARFAQWAKRTRPPLGGESVLRQSIAIPPDIGAQAESLVREIDLEGYSEVEFRRDDVGTPYLMEINPRLSASVEIAVRAGVDFPSLLFQWASGEPVERVAGYRVGGWMRHLGGDIDSLLAMFNQRGRPGIPPPAQAVTDFGLSFLQPMRYDYFDWMDPLPAVRATTDFTRDAMERVARRLARGVGVR
jgi:predicted ATP-grasp superfamily ATP-dependent carboligase